jgi:hypothetical protein
MQGRDQLTAAQLQEGLPVILDGATKGIPVYRSEHSPPETWLQDGHPGRIKPAPMSSSPHEGLGGGQYSGMAQKAMGAVSLR